MLLSCHQLLFAGLITVIVLVGTRGYEIIEGRYKGEKYTPKTRGLMNVRRHYSNTYDKGRRDQYVPSGYRGFTPVDNRDRGMRGAYGEMVKQLSSVLHRRIARPLGGRRREMGRNDFRGRSLQEQSERSRKAEGSGVYYHYYPNNNQRLKLPECATQQVCNAVYVRLNMTQSLCACPPLSDPCSPSYRSDDQHTIELKMKHTPPNAVTLAKTCEPVWSVRDCQAPRDWAILALQNSRTGKSHFLVICKCPESRNLEGSLDHDQPRYAKVPGIRVFGMICKESKRRKRSTYDEQDPEFPWQRLYRELEKGNLIEDLLLDVPRNATEAEENTFITSENVRRGNTHGGNFHIVSKWREGKTLLDKISKRR